MGKVNSIPTNPKTSVYTTASLMASNKVKHEKNGGKMKQKKITRKVLCFIKTLANYGKNLH